MGTDAVPRLTTERAPLIDLDPRYYRTIAGFEARLPAGAPSLRQAERLRVRGDWTFASDVVLRGDVALDDTGRPEEIPGGTHLPDQSR